MDYDCIGPEGDTKSNEEGGDGDVREFVSICQTYNGLNSCEILSGPTMPFRA
jgi:hypothetical protein